MTNEELAKNGFELCEMGGDCDFCETEVEQKDYFWHRTSYEYIEGDYYCRECASKEVSAFEGFLTPLALDGGDSPRQPSQSTLEGFTPAEQGTTPAPRQ